MKDKVNHIVDWIKSYAEKNHKTSLVVGVSGGIDSSVVSTLCAMTGIKTIPIDERLISTVSDSSRSQAGSPTIAPRWTTSSTSCND